jgi:hypothetical protein
MKVARLSVAVDLVPAVGISVEFMVTKSPGSAWERSKLFLKDPFGNVVGL